MTTDKHLTRIDDIPFSVDMPGLLRRLHADETFVLMEELQQAAREAESVARPKGIYRLCAVRHTGEDSVTLDGISFTSRVLRVNLEGAHRAFPFLATCGSELEAWSRAMEDPLQAFWADIMKEMALHQAITALGNSLVEKYQPGKRAVMNPGSLPDWPIGEQRPLFSLFGKEAENIGVSLTESCLMSPVKSVSGVWFQTEAGFVNCQLCPRVDCPNRRAPHDPHVFPSRYEYDKQDSCGGE